MHLSSYYPALGRVLRVCPHGEEVHARKGKLYAPTQETAFYNPDTLIIVTYPTKWVVSSNASTL
jgi:hypothetical protein